jgi:uncharacterized protein with HEPN domain
MRPDERDAAYLWDMLDSSKTLRSFVTGVTFYSYAQDKKLQLAVERALEIIGEAARRVSESYRQEHREIPWPSIIAQRNVLAHEYGEIKQELIWKVATIRIPELISLLERLIPIPPGKES